MALDNLISVSFTTDELVRMDAALSEIENIMKGKAVNLTPKQRQLYGKVAYEMEVWVEKVFGYMTRHPESIPSYIDMVEHTADLEAHRALNPRIEKLTGILESMQDTNRLLGYDIDHNSRSYHRAQREAAKENAPGATARYNDLKQQFPGGKSDGKNEEK